MKYYFFHSGQVSDGGQYQCLDCGKVISLNDKQVFPDCPDSGSIPHMYKMWKKLEILPRIDSRPLGNKTPAGTP